MSGAEISAEGLIARDARVAWHPLTQHQTEPTPLPVLAAKDSVLTLADGRELIDGISSWWACLHGHGQPELIEAMTNQARTLDHVLFAGATHEPAVALLEELLEVAPRGLSRGFFSDNGSTAVEVALKMVYQSWLQRDQPDRRIFVTFDGSYHGDTLGAMSVGDPDPYFRPFVPLMFDVRRIPVDPAALGATLGELGEQAAGVILEPLVQGAAGMVMHSPEFVRAVRSACDAAGVPFIADEVMTGFGRTGTRFACEQAGITPDLICLAKGLTGGLLPLSVTLTTEPMYEAFLSDERARAFFHGHTFTGHPIACAVARASLRLVKENDVPGRLDRIGRRVEAGVAELTQARPERVRELRRTGGIVALELAPKAGEGDGYFATMGPELRRGAIERGVLLRPLGNVLYAMPPACTTDEQCDRIAAVMAELAGI